MSSISHPPRTTIITIAVIIIVMSMSVGFQLFGRPATEGQEAEDSEGVVVEALPSTPPASISPTGTDRSASAYKDGVYTATGSYNTPGGTERIEITLTIANDIVTAAKAVSKAEARESKEFQAEFIAGFQQAVVGKPLAGLSLNRVSGSSLTPKGFNSAVTAIRNRAS